MNEIKNLESANFDHLELLAGGEQAICPGAKKIYICPGVKKFTFALVAAPKFIW